MNLAIPTLSPHYKSMLPNADSAPVPIAREQAEHAANLVQALGVSLADAQFIATHFEPDDRYESTATIHEDPDLQRRLSDSLVANMRAKQQELTDSLLYGVFGRHPSNAARKAYLEIKNAPESAIRWLHWMDRPLVLLTIPLTYISGGKIRLRWYWRNTDFAARCLSTARSN